MISIGAFSPAFEDLQLLVTGTSTPPEEISDVALSGAVEISFVLTDKEIWSYTKQHHVQLSQQTTNVLFTRKPYERDCSY